MISFIQFQLLLNYIRCDLCNNHIKFEQIKFDSVHFHIQGECCECKHTFKWNNTHYYNGKRSAIGNTIKLVLY